MKSRQQLEFEFLPESILQYSYIQVLSASMYSSKPLGT